MARIKFFAFLLVAAAVAVVGLMKLSGRAGDLAQLESAERLAWGKTLFETSHRLALSMRGNAARDAAQDRALVEALGDGSAAPTRAAFDAFAKSSAAALGKLPEALRTPAILLVGTDTGVLSGAPGGAEPSANADKNFSALATAADSGGGFVTVNGALWQIAAAPVLGADKVVGRVGFAFPVDEAVIGTQAKDLGLGVTLSLGDKTLSSLPEEAQGSAAAVVTTDAPAAIELSARPAMGPVQLPLFVADPAMGRALSFPLEGVEGAKVVLTEESPILRELAQFQQSAVLGLAGVIVLGFAVLLLLGGGAAAQAQTRPAPQAGAVTQAAVEAMAAPEKTPATPAPENAVERPEDSLPMFGASTSTTPEVPAMPLEAAPAQAEEPAPVPGQELAPEPAQEVAPEQLEELPAAAATLEPEPEPAPVGSEPTQALTGTPFDPPAPAPTYSSGLAMEAIPLPPPEPPPGAQDPFASVPQSSSMYEAEVPTASKRIDPFALAAAQMPAEEQEERHEATVVAAVPSELLRAASKPQAQSAAVSAFASAVAIPLPSPSGPPPGLAEDAHFQEVFQQFVATRAQCNEPADGLTFDKFAAKLRKNKEQLVQKYNCKSVRFQVYVKDGKAALKATPVKD